MSEQPTDEEITDLCRLLNAYATKHECEKCKQIWIQITSNGFKRELQPCPQCGPVKYTKLTPERLKQLQSMSKEERADLFKKPDGETPQ